MVRPTCLGLIIKGPSSQHVIPKLWLLLPQECVKIQMCSSHVKKKSYPQGHFSFESNKQYTLCIVFQNQHLMNFNISLTCL